MAYQKPFAWKQSLLRCSGILLGLILTSACTTVNHKVGEALNLDTDLKLEIVATESLNPDEKEQASPVFIRLYELNANKAFEAADFIDLYENDAKTLADTLVAKQELKRLVPGTEVTERFVLSEGTRYVALFAEFYRYKDAQAKVIFPVTSSNVIRNSIKVMVSGNKITLQEK